MARYKTGAHETRGATQIMNRMFALLIAIGLLLLGVAAAAYAEPLATLPIIG